MKSSFTEILKKKILIYLFIHFSFILSILLDYISLWDALILRQNPQYILIIAIKRYSSEQLHRNIPHKLNNKMRIQKK